MVYLIGNYCMKLISGWNGDLKNRWKKNETFSLKKRVSA
jgi:hypothetical protein